MPESPERRSHPSCLEARGITVPIFPPSIPLNNLPNSLGTLVKETPPRLDLLWCTKPGMVEDSYAAVPVELPASSWRDPRDYEIMTATLEQAQKNRR